MWLGHVLRIDHHSHPRIALTWVPEGNLARLGEEQNLEKNSGEWIKSLGRGSISCRGQDSLETESVQPNSPPGEWFNDDDDD